MPETPLPNEASARTETGELKAPTTALTEQPGTPATTTTPPTSTPSTPEKPAEGKPAEGKSTVLNEGKPAALTGAPEKYEGFAAPEGMEFNQERLAPVLETFKELNLSQAGAQKIMDLYTKEVTEANEAPYQLWQDTQEQWRNEIARDPVIGGKLDQVRASTSKMIDGLGDPKLAADFRAAMDFTGAGNNPAFIRLFYQLAQRMTEGSAVSGGGPAGVGTPGGGKPSSVAQAMYPNLPSGNRS